MENWNGYRGELMSTLGQMGEISPELLSAHDKLASAKPKEPKLDAKTRELIALAVAVTTRCDGCIAFHTDAARKAGASKEEMVEALGVAVALNAGAALVYSARAFDAFTRDAG
jgi:AhpD family alkylhydroperoxidase